MNHHITITFVGVLCLCLCGGAVSVTEHEPEVTEPTKDGSADGSKCGGPAVPEPKLTPEGPVLPIPKPILNPPPAPHSEKERSKDPPSFQHPPPPDPDKAGCVVRGGDPPKVVTKPETKPPADTKPEFPEW